MKRIQSISFILILLFPLGVISALPANAAKTGSACKKLNSKGWDGNNPIVCKRNKSGKLVWTKFNTTTNQSSTPTPTPTPTRYKLTINLGEINETFLSTDSRSVEFCNMGGYRYQDIGATTGVEIRDGNGNLLATAALGSAKVIDVPGQILGVCSFTPVLDVAKSDFYQVKIGTRYSKSFSFADFEKMKWQLELYIGS